jgi:hypothetical protein
VKALGDRATALAVPQSGTNSSDLGLLTLIAVLLAIPLLLLSAIEPARSLVHPRTWIQR